MFILSALNFCLFAAAAAAALLACSLLLLLLFSDNLEAELEVTEEAADDKVAAEAEVLLLLFRVTDDAVDMMAKPIHLSICTVT